MVVAKSGGTPRALSPSRLYPSVTFLLAWTFLDVVVNVRYPGRETRLWYLIPCIDLVVLFAGFALLGHFRRRLPAWAHVALAVLVVVIRWFRVGDGISMRFLHRPFNLYVNLSLLPEVPRLLRATLPTGSVIAAGAALVLGTVAVGVGSYFALRLSERRLAERANVKLFGVVVAAFALASFIPQRQPDPRFFGAFAASGVGRLVSEASAVSAARGTGPRKAREVHEARQALAKMPSDLARLEGADVLIFLVESYGQSVLEVPAQAARVRPEFEAFERELGAEGYTIASGILDSPTFGGGSWLAHATLDTGVRTGDQLEYDLVCGYNPLTIVDFFNAAGYRSVLVQPATERPTRQADYLRFHQKYYRKNFDYQGPLLGWGKLADQYVIDFVHRRELASPKQPLFIEYALVTSHAPWLAEATIVDDWSKLGDGKILTTLPIKQHATEWSSLDQAMEAYMDAVVYDLEVLRRYLRTVLRHDALVIILGDHQPPGGVTHSSFGFGVPVHVLSRRPGLVAPFRARGYVPGMWPAAKPPHPGMESFLFAFLRDFSQEPRQTKLLPGFAQ